MPNLIVLNGLRQGTVVPLRDSTVIGRGARVDLQLPDHLVSSEHAKIVRTNGAYLLQDMGSTNCTFCNGIRVDLTHRLQLGDVVQVGTTEFMFTQRGALEGLKDEPPPRAPVSDSPLTGTLVLPILQSVERRITQAPDLETFLARLSHELAKRSGAKGVHVVLAREAGRQVALRVALQDDGEVQRLDEGQGFPVKASLVAHALDGTSGAIIAQAGAVRDCCLGLPHGERMIAAVYLHDVPDDLTEESVEPLVHLASLAGVHCRTHMLVSELKEQNAKLQMAQGQLVELNAELHAGLAKRTEELSRSERSYRGLFEDSRDGNLTVDSHGRILAINRAAAQILDVRPDQVVGASLWGAFEPPLTTSILAMTSEQGTSIADTQRFTFELSSLAKRPAPDVIELPLETAQGERTIELLVRPLGGQVLTGVHAILRDVTARSEAEHQRRLLARIVENVPDAVVSMTLDGEVTSWNPGAQELYGYSEAETIGQVLPTLPDGYGAEFERVLEAVREGRTLSLRSQRVDRQDRTIPVHVTFAPVPDPLGANVGVVELARDLSEQLELEGRMRWRERMASFGELAAGLAHELGNPIASLRGGVDYLLDKALDSETRESLVLLQSEMERLQGLVQKSLDLARWEPPRLTEIGLEGVLSHVASVVRERATTQGVEVVEDVPHAPLQVLGDEDQLKQALLNLVNNALEAMPDGGRLVLEGFARDDRCGFLVRDTGRGIAAEYRERIFDLFFSRRPGGTGIGLAVVKRIVDLHQGGVTLESGEEGSTFEVWLPSEKASRGT